MDYPRFQSSHPPPLKGPFSLSLSFFPMASYRQNGIPGRELLICLIVVCARPTDRGGAEAGPVERQSNRGLLHPNPGHLGSSNEGGRPDGARRETKQGSRGHDERERQAEQARAELGSVERRAETDRAGGEAKTGGLKSPRSAPGFCRWCEAVLCLRQKLPKPVAARSVDA